MHGGLKLPNIEEGKKVKSYVMKVILKYLSSDVAPCPIESQLNCINNDEVINHETRRYIH